jgi:hypothetical protein
MKLHAPLKLLLAACWWRAFAAGAELQIVTDNEPQYVFAGGARMVRVLCQNAGDQPVAMLVRMQMYQASSVTVMAVGSSQAWKQLQVLPGQTVVESALIAFPSVKAVTHFVIQWLDETNKVLGRSDVMVYPTNLLEELKPLLGEHETALGVLDPTSMLNAALKNTGLHFVDLEETRLEEFDGKLALIGPCSPSDPEWNGLSGRVRKLSRRGIGVVWFQAMPRKRNELWPSFFAVPHDRTGVVIAQPALAKNVSEDPQSQLNLIYFCKLALHVQTPVVPDLSPTP